MRNRNPRLAILAALALGVVVSAASPASADHTGFSKNEYEVAEGSGYVELSVETDFCCPPGSGQIDYYTSNLSATAGDDYQQTSGTLTFPAEYKIRVPIIDDELFEGEEQFVVTLTNYRGTFVNRGRTTAVVRIHDDDPKPSSGRTSTSRSSEQTVRSAGGSSARPPSLSQGSAGAGGQSGVIDPSAKSPVHQGDVALPTEADARDDAEAIVPKAGRDKSDDSSLLLVALGTLLLVAGAGLWLKRKLRRRLT